ncbi:MAG TPA: glycosyltransferase 87 family protein, partial [Chloroflexota bacterium]
LFYLSAVVVLVRAERDGRDLPGVLLVLALAWAVMLRVGLLATTPSLSDDVYRYVWDGKVIAAGIDPYAYPPAAPELSALRDPLWNGINHKEMRTPYPPLAEVLFAAVYHLAPGAVAGMQAGAVLFDLGVILVIIGLLARLGLKRWRVLIYAWNPLVLVQFAHSGHFDSAMLLSLLGAVLLIASGRRLLSGVTLGVSVLTKLVPAMLGPLFLPFWGVAGTVAAGATVIAGTAPLIGQPALAGVLTEASDARFNDSAGFLLVRLLSPATPNAEAIARTGASALVALTSLTLGALLWRRRASWREVPGAIYAVIGLFIVMNAVVEPWYLTWIVPFLCFAIPSGSLPGGWRAPSWGWLLLSGTVMLTDLTYSASFDRGTWLWVRVAEYGPLFCLLLLWAAGRVVQGRAPRAAGTTPAVE